MTNEYVDVKRWEYWATEHLIKKFGLTVLDLCDDYKRNHDEGTDAITKELGRVDWKWPRCFDYKRIFFPLEHRTIHGDTWVENKKALELNVKITYVWKDYSRPGYYKLAAYPISKLKELLDIKRMGNIPCTAKSSGTQFYRVEMEELEDIKVWDSGWVWLGREETTWLKLFK